MTQSTASSLAWTCISDAQYPYNWVLPTGHVFTFIDGLSRIIRQDGEHPTPLNVVTLLLGGDF
jgi:hypothetical protein